MKDSLFIIVTRRGIERTCKTDGFTLKSGERAFRLEVDIPDAAFAPARVPTIKMHIPEEALITEITVNADIPEREEG